MLFIALMSITNTSLHLILFLILTMKIKLQFKYFVPCFKLKRLNSTQNTISVIFMSANPLKSVCVCVCVCVLSEMIYFVNSVN
jgi:hypothetical protein